MQRQIALLTLAVAAITQLAACGSPKRCTEKNPASFATFLDEEWRVYCASYRDHVESPANYKMLDLAQFFGEHPRRVKQLKKSLFGHDKFETCFESPKAELELRTLQTCLEDNDQSDLEITNAFSAVTEPWLAELQLRLQEVSPRLSDAEREVKRQKKKVSEAFDFQNRIEGRSWESLQVELKSIQKELGLMDGTDARYNEIVGASQGHDNLVRMLQSDIGPEVATIAADVAALRARHAELDTEARYLEFGSLAAGVKCPASLKGASSELRTAKKIVSGRNNEVGGSGPRILTKVRADAADNNDFERFEGFVCGIRGPENQFDGAPQLCAQYRFIVERQKPAGASKREWSNWTLKSFDESGSSGGVDCALKKK